MTDGLKVISTFQFSPTSQEVLREAANTEVACITRTDEFLSRLQEAEIICSYWMPANWRRASASSVFIASRRSNCMRWIAGGSRNSWNGSRDAWCLHSRLPSSTCTCRLGRRRCRASSSELSWPRNRSRSLRLGVRSRLTSEADHPWATASNTRWPVCASWCFPRPGPQAAAE